eukprot:GEMP01048482.1.p1 GENE.GEMP01048482.1~~GEMP01048482.1.p1  ORF type:complete len:247 (+),score=33.52 GEMP01048482.1:56-742(+)
MEKLRCAGFAQRETKVRRCGDMSEYHFDGTWKPSSFTNRAEQPHLSWGKCTESHPSLLPPHKFHYVNFVKRENPVPLDPNNLIARVGYRGFIPRKDAETVFGAVKTAVQHECHQRVDYADAIREYKCIVNEPQGKKPLEEILATTDLKHSCNMGYQKEYFRRDMWPAPQRQQVFKDHHIPRERPKTFGTLRHCRSTPVILRQNDFTVLHKITGHAGYRPMNDKNCIFP